MVCKLKLIRHGLIKESRDIDDVRAVAGPNVTITAGDSQEDSDSDNDADAKGLMERRNQFVQQCLSEAKREGWATTQKTEATAIARTAVIRDFMSAITKSRKCANCQAVNPKYRKDRFVKIFRIPLSDKEKLSNIQKGLKVKEAVIEISKKAKRVNGAKRKREEKDEGVADMDLTEEEESEEGESVASSEGEPEIAGGNMVDEVAGEGKKSKKDDKAQHEYVNPARVRAQLVKMFELEQDVLAYVYGNGPSRKSRTRGENNTNQLTADMFFIHDILIPPNRFRPEARTGNDEIAEAQENTLYKNILNICETLSTIQREISEQKSSNERYRPRTYTDLENTWAQLQDAVNSMIDRDRNPIQGAAGRRNADGVKQKLEKKEGMFRKYMMGKRVNFAARTVISPDPNIETNEIGVPPVFAVKLTYPEPVTHWNVEELQEAVRNGPFVWPGAVAIESETGSVVSLERKTPDERTALANNLLAPSTIPSGPGTRGTRP
jgi:DNA-directed RNA polymerase beta' subunit